LLWIRFRMSRDGRAEMSTRRSFRQAPAYIPILLALLVPLYMLTFAGSFRADDEHILAARSQSLAIWGMASEPQVYGNTRVQTLIPYGDQATQIEPAQAFLGSFLYKVGIQLGAGGAKALFLLNVYLTALTAVVVFLMAQEIGFGGDVSAWCAVLFGVGTIAWPFATTYFRDPLAMFLSAVAVLGWARIEGRSEAGLATGILLMLAGTLGGILAKNSVAAILPAFMAAATTLWAFRTKPRGVARRGIVAALLMLVLPVTLSLLVPEQGAFARFHWGYYRQLAGYFAEGLKLSLLEAMAGPFLSPSRSLFIFSPVLLLSLVGVPRFWRQKPGFTILSLAFVLLIAIGQALFYRQAWAGSYAPGPRFMLPALPSLAVLMAPTLEILLRGNPRRGKAILLAALTLGGLVQIGGALVSWNLVTLDWMSQGLDPFASGAAWDIRYLIIPGLVQRLARPASWTSAWIRLAQVGDPRLAPCVLIVMGVLALAGVLLWKVGRDASLARRYRGAIAASGIAAAGLPILMLLALFRGDPYWGEGMPAYQQSMETIRADLEESDVVLIDSYGTTLWRYWMDHWRDPVRWYSLPYEIPGSSAGSPTPATRDLLDRLPLGHANIWYVVTEDAPDVDFSQERAWLDERCELDRQAAWDGHPAIRVRRYVFCAKVGP